MEIIHKYKFLSLHNSLAPTDLVQVFPEGYPDS